MRCLVEYRRWRKRPAGHSSKGVALGYSDHRRWRTNPWPTAIFNTVPGRAKHPKVFWPTAIYNIARGIALGLGTTTSLFGQVTIFNAVPGRAKHPKVFWPTAIYNIARGIALGLGTTTSMFGQRPYSIHLQNVRASYGDLYNVGPMTPHRFLGAIGSSAASNLFCDVETRP